MDAQVMEEKVMEKKKEEKKKRSQRFQAKVQKCFLDFEWETEGA